MIRYLESSDIDPQQWDRCIAASDYSTIFASFDFLSAASDTWGALITGEYESVMPLPYRSRFGMRYIFSPPFISRLGIYSKNKIDHALEEKMIEMIPKKFVLTDLVLNPLHQYPGTTTHVSYQLALNQEYEELKKQYNENTKRNLKKVNEEELIYSQDVTIEQIIDLFSNNRGENVKLPKHFYSTLLKLSKVADQQRCLEKKAVYDLSGNLLAGALFLHDFQRVWFWFSGRDQAKSDQMGMFHLIDLWIRHNANRELILDFNGSNNPNIARFYHGFGAEKYEYPFYQKKKNGIKMFINAYKYLIK